MVSNYIVPASKAIEAGMDARLMIKDLAKEINGGGGGQVFYATAGGSRAEGLKVALEKAGNT